MRGGISGGAGSGGGSDSPPEVTKSSKSIPMELSAVDCVYSRSSFCICCNLNFSRSLRLAMAAATAPAASAEDEAPLLEEVIPPIEALPATARHCARPLFVRWVRAAPLLLLSRMLGFKLLAVELVGNKKEELSALKPIVLLPLADRPAAVPAAAFKRSNITTLPENDSRSLNESEFDCISYLALRNGFVLRVVLQLLGRRATLNDV